jgi:thiamine-phosphate diphosphorylase
MAVPQGIWAVASDLQSVDQAEQWCRSAAPAAAFTARRTAGSDPQVLQILRALKRASSWLACHGRADLAQTVGANAVIAGVRSLPVASYRRSFPGLLVGASTHTMAEAEAAIGAGAHFLFYGPVWDTPEKSGILQPRGVENLKAVVALGVPVIAIGGIESATQVQQVQSAGVHGAAVLRAARNAHTMQELVGAWR